VRLVFATCDHQPLITADDQILADALTGRGVEVTPIPWTELDPYAILDSPPILLRSTWDYHRLPTLFRSWLLSLADSGRATWNPPAVASGNIDKIYLKALEAAGIAIPRTRWLESIDRESLSAALTDEGWDRAVLKPRIAATAYGTFLIDHGTPLSDEDLHPARNSGALLQEVIPEVVERGEISMVFFGGVFSHAVVKRAKSGEFRVQKDFGGQVERTTPSAALSAFAGTVMTHVPADCLYARVDVVETARGPLLMELELIEPELYFSIVPESAHRLADPLVRALATV
jgi:glutathione synthase/RimK-type ligase-like ATP-grasp enzyme